MGQVLQEVREGDAAVADHALNDIAVMTEEPARGTAVMAMVAPDLYYLKLTKADCASALLEVHNGICAV